MPPEYAERIVAFIDILGFSALVRQIGEDATKQQKLHDALHRIRSMENYPRLSGNEEHISVSVFSDSIVISAAKDHFTAVMWAAATLQTDLLAMGILVRGGISRGKTVHADGILYGEGMIKAYELESKTAIYPRIVIDPGVVSRLPAKYRAAILNVDADGLSYLDPFAMGVNSYPSSSQDMAAEGYCPYEESLKLLSERIDAEIGRLTDIGQIAKWQWLRGKSVVAHAELLKQRTPRYWHWLHEARTAKAMRGA